MVFRVKQQFQGSVTYSWRSATAGSTRLARQAGAAQAAKATTASTSGAARNVTGSAGFTPYSSAASKWVSAAAPANPMAMPVSAIRRPLPATIRSTSAERAPSAMRMPNSRVRRLTENASTPKIPTAASASAPNVPTSCARKRGWAMDWAATSSMVRTRVTACSFVHARDGGLHRGRHRQRISRGTHRDRCGEPRILCNRHVDLQLILLGGPRDFDLMNYAHHLAHHGLRSAHIHGLYSYVRPNLLHARLHALQIPPHQFFVDDAHRRGRGIVVFREGAAAYQPDPQRLEILCIDHLIVRRWFLGLAYRRRAHHGESLADFPAIHRQAEPQPHGAHARQAGHFTLGGLVECERALGRFVPRQRERDVHRQDAIRVVARIHAVQRDHGTQQQTRAGDEHDGDRDLGDGQGGSECSARTGEAAARNASVSEMRLACHVGAMPNSRPVSSVASSVNPAIRASKSRVIDTGSVSSDSHAGAARKITSASRMPAAPPIADSSTLSVSSCRRMRAGLPPNDARTAISRVRPTPRASSRFAMLAQAISSTKPATAASIRDVIRRSRPTSACRSGSTVMPQPLLVSGAMRAMFSAIGAMPARACSNVTPGFKRPRTCR